MKFSQKDSVLPSLSNKTTLIYMHNSREIFQLLRNVLLTCVLYVLCLKISTVYRLSQEYQTDKYECPTIVYWPDVITVFLLQQLLNLEPY